MLKNARGATGSPLNVLAELSRVGRTVRSWSATQGYQRVPDLSIFSKITPSTCLFENSHRLLGGWFSSMATAARQYTSGQIDKAGKVLSSPSATKQEADDAIAVMDSWRFAHNRPLEMARGTLESRSKLINPSCTI